MFQILLLFSNHTYANEPAESPNKGNIASLHTYLSCALITSEHLTTLQLYQRGLPKKLALEALPNISRQGRKRVDYVYDFAKQVGVLNAYTDINTNFSRCAYLVHKTKGVPARDLKEYGYYFCSGENKVRFELLLYIDQGYTSEKLKTIIAKKHHHLIGEYQNLVKNRGNLAAFDLIANNLKACLQQIE